MSSTVTLPELGPALGRLVHPGSPKGIDGALAPVRLGLVTRLLVAAGKAREALAAGNEPDARRVLSPTVWAAEWNRASEDAATQLILQLDRRITAAAVSARMPEWRAERHRVRPEEHRAIHARLGAGAGAMLRAAAELEHVTGDEWSEQVLATARRLESAWAGLQEAAARELAGWESDIQLVALWRRARWPLWTVTAVVLSVALWAGLMLGGFLPVPRILLPVADMLWGHL